MLTSRPRPRKRGKQPPLYGYHGCPLDYEKLKGVP
jgi:hypothetical protein